MIVYIANGGKLYDRHAFLYPNLSIDSFRLLILYISNIQDAFALKHNHSQKCRTLDLCAS